MKVLAIASAGGHWIQLLRLKPAFEGHSLVFMSTKLCFAETVKGYNFYRIPDANRREKLRLFYSMFCITKRIILLQPDLVITTGAAPGLLGIIAGKICGAKTVWIDSIANVEKISMSCKIASSFADRTYTQWPELTTEKIIFNGNVLS
ncbi:glycosyltransferase family protein [Mucilaginibacter arboris]|uniref:Oligosaccharide biosynthesis protein Alg14 n=1 Tax=Mucilaginibacter arboris TaxID=2682090 RepID=A0A7K1SXR3_9SPHI|nr:oligosaccharide biosynthesis protein Alg14 [Mucilaginibacter arboris]MVN22038.1 oligosaccharide biosynthesis protein Alg14 [Mucilaginibacter arboris]